MLMGTETSMPWNAAAGRRGRGSGEDYTRRPCDRHHFFLATVYGGTLA